MGKKTIFATLLLLATTALAGCGPSYDEAKRASRAERQRLQREDSLALKVGVLPTLDCLPIYVAKEQTLFDTAMADIRLKPFASQIDCDEALRLGKIEGAATDIVRGQHLKREGLQLDYVAATNAYWQLVSNRMARIRRLEQLDDKMVAMTRHSATALLADYATDSAKLERDKVFKIQINDVNLRLLMLANNEMDAMLLPEPQATAARLRKSPVLMDGRSKDMHLGVIAFNSNAMKDERRRKQLEEFIKGYNSACDSINKNGLRHYAGIMAKYFKIDNATINALPKTVFKHAETPRRKDIETADKWLKNN